MEKHAEYCLIVEGNYFDETEAEHALRDPFIEEWVEQTGKFRIHNFDDIDVAGGISLGDLSVECVEDEIFKVFCHNNARFMNLSKANQLAEAIRRQGMFDEIKIEPLGQNTATD